MNYKNIIFDFSSSYTGGGLKRLNAYLNYFNNKGGSNFVINEILKKRIKKNNNKIFFVKKTIFSNLFIPVNHLKYIQSSNPNIEFCYSYGTPATKKIFKYNIIHVSNILPFILTKNKISLIDKFRYQILKNRFLHNFKFANLVSYESKSSLKLIKKTFKFPKSSKFFLSINPADIKLNQISNYKNIVITVGTQSYKNVNLVIDLFYKLKINDPKLELHIISEHHFDINSNNKIKIFKNLSRNQVVKKLSQAKYYINASSYENSYNNATEGIFLSKFSFLSCIDVHKELLIELKYPKIKKVNNFYFLEKNKISNFNKPTWDQDCKLLIKQIDDFK